MRDRNANPPFRGWNRCCYQDGVPLDVAIGRALACCVHPVVAWRRSTAYGRVGLVAAYVSASYVTMLAALLLA